MIKKLIKIKNVGRFKSFSTKNDETSFNKTTVIFGYNTYGKSTLTAIFRSLRDNNIHYIQGRKTFGSSLADKQEIEVVDSKNNTFVFNSKWGNKNIEIFDNDFITKNVFYGDSINSEQQSSLYEILIGDEVYELKQKIYNLKKEQTGLEKNKTDIENEFTKKGFGTFDVFQKLKQDVDIDRKIQETQDEIKQQENINSLKALIAKTYLKSTFSKFKTEFFKTLDLSVEKILSDHIEKNWNSTTASKDFLSCGLDLLKEKGGCVFCGQDLTAVHDFISNLQKIFSDEYKNLKENINRLGNQFIAIDLEKSFLEFENYGLNLRKKLDYEKLQSVKKNIDNKIRLKQNDLSIQLDFDNDPDFKVFLIELGKLATVFTDIEVQPVEDSSRLSSLRNNLLQQKLIKYRFSADGISIFDRYNEAQNKLEIKKEEIKKLNNELTVKVNKIFEENEKEINYFLKELGANFLLKNFSPKSHMGRINTHFCHFQFIIDTQHIISISNKKRKDEPEPENMPHFKNTLSDSDRRILAFSFFLAKLSNDKNIKDKIIVLDDPFSSFDENRKDGTAKLLVKLKNKKGDEPLQKIILTHDSGFLCRLFDKLPNESKVLKIHYSKQEGSILEYCDVQDDFLKETYFKDIEYIKKSVENSKNINESLKKVRPCLEHLLKRKYYFLLSPETLMKKSIGDYLNEIGSACPLKDEIMNDNWHENMHDGHAIMQLNDPAKIEKLVKFLELIKNI